MMEITGNLCEINKTFQWKIKDFLLLQDKSGDGYKSPQFSLFGVSWELWICPYGRKRDKSVGWISVFLVSISIPKPATVNYSFKFKAVNERNGVQNSLSFHFKEKNAGWGFPKFILRSDLIRRQFELLPSGILTVIYTLKKNEPHAISEFLDASAQTEEGTEFLDASAQTEEGAEFLDASAQTEGGTGIWALQQHLSEMLLNGDISDVVLKVEDQEFKSHRCILAARSPVFMAMMKNEIKESVDIKDIDPKTFSDFLKYLYTGGKEYITSENVTKLYTAADKYKIEVLKENCLDHMLEKVSIENFCDFFLISVYYNEKNLKETCIQYFAKHSLDIMETSKWQSFLSENPIVGNELLIKFIELNKDNLRIP